MEKYIKIYLNKIVKISIISIFIIIVFFNPCFADENVEELDFSWNEFQKIIKISSEAHEIPKINSRVAVIFDRASGDIIYGKEQNKKYKMASTTKIMSAIVVLENSNLMEVVNISKKSANTGGSRLGLKFEDKITVNDLLYGLMLSSGNDAAVALAEPVGGSIQDFAEMMNKKAEEIGLTSTHFVTPHGLDQDEHYTTAYELAKTADYALKNKKFREIVGTKEYTVTINGKPKKISNTNELLGNLNGVYGIKTGYTNGANRCLVTGIKRGNLDIICVVLGADTKKYRTQDSVKLIEYAFSNYEIVNLKEKIEEEFENWKNFNKIEIIKGEKKYLDTFLQDNNIQYKAIKKDEINDIKVSILGIKTIEAGVSKNKKVGQLNVKIHDENICNLDILVKNEVKRKTAKFYFKELIFNYANKLEENLNNK